MKKNLLVILLLCLSIYANAQSRKITGSVVGADDGSALPGVVVRIVGTTMGTQTNATGNFAITVPASAKSLQLSYLGYKTLTVELTSASVYNLKLSSDNKALTEVVVTGYGVQQKREVTGAISQLKATEIEDRPIQTVDKALQGRAAGVQVTSSSGQPGGGLSVIIRGTATINGTTQPLYIVDGVQLTTGNISGQTSVNSLSSINPDDIESIEILKDAASAAIYGSLAGNGVVIITTKRGKNGKTVVNFSAQYGTTKNYNPYKTVNATEYFMLQAEAYDNQATRRGLASGSARQAAINSSFPSGVLPSEIQSYDYIKAITQTGKVQQYDLSFNGGDARTKFFVAGSFNNTEGTILNSSFTRGTFRANVDHKVSDKFSLQATVALTGSGEKGPSTNAGFFTNTPFTGAALTSPVNPIYNADGTFNTAQVGINANNNIVQNVALEVRQAGTFQTVSNLGMTYNILPELSFRAFGGLEFSDVRDLNYRPAIIPIYSGSLGTGSETYRRNVNYNTSGTFNFIKKIGADHNISALAGFEYRSVTNQTLGASAQGFPSPLLILVSSGSQPTAATSTFTGFKVAGFLANAKYDYKGKYMLSANVRRDGSSRFGDNNKYGTFYGASAGWNVTSESFMEKFAFISQLKPRVSYGVTGSQPGSDFTGLSLYGGGGQYGNPLLGGLRPVAIVNPDFTWEKSAQIDLGLDFGFLNNRITGAFDVYRKKNTELILGLTTPGDSGFTAYTVNAGKAQSEGIELQIASVNLDGPFKWNTNFNISWNRTKLLELVNGLQQTGTYTYTVGTSLQNIYTYQWAGVNPADGRPMYYDAKGNITYSPVAADQRIIGNQLPRFYGGFNNTFTYAGVSLDVLFQYQYGNKSYLQTQQYLETAGSIASNQSISQLNRWTTPGQITSVPRPYLTGTEPGGYNIQNFSSRFVEDASYIRLKQVNLSYKLPKSVTDKMKMGSLSVFLQALNLATFTNYRGDDPENAGNNLNFYPNARTLTAGINAKF